MGYYIQTPSNHGKGDWLVEKYDAVPVSINEALRDVDDHDIVVVMDNGPFEAAGYAYNQRELLGFVSNPMDKRPKQCYRLPKGVAATLSGYD